MSFINRVYTSTISIIPPPIPHHMLTCLANVAKSIVSTTTDAKQNTY